MNRRLVRTVTFAGQRAHRVAPGFTSMATMGAMARRSIALLDFDDEPTAASVTAARTSTRRSQPEDDLQPATGNNITAPSVSTPPEETPPPTPSQYRSVSTFGLSDAVDRPHREDHSATARQRNPKFDPIKPQPKTVRREVLRIEALQLDVHPPHFFDAMCQQAPSTDTLEGRQSFIAFHTAYRRYYLLTPTPGDNEPITRRGGTHPYTVQVVGLRGRVLFEGHRLRSVTNAVKQMRETTSLYAARLSVPSSAPANILQTDVCKKTEQDLPSRTDQLETGAACQNCSTRPTLGHHEAPCQRDNGENSTVKGTTRNASSKNAVAHHRMLAERVCAGVALHAALHDEIQRRLRLSSIDIGPEASESPCVIGEAVGGPTCGGSKAHREANAAPVMPAQVSWCHVRLAPEQGLRTRLFVWDRCERKRVAPNVPVQLCLLKLHAAPSPQTTHQCIQSNEQGALVETTKTVIGELEGDPSPDSARLDSSSLIGTTQSRRGVPSHTNAHGTATANEHGTAVAKAIIDELEKTVTFVASEVAVGDRKLGIAGRIDAVALDNATGRTVVLDWKTVADSSPWSHLPRAPPLCAANTIPEREEMNDCVKPFQCTPMQQQAQVSALLQLLLLRTIIMAGQSTNETPQSGAQQRPSSMSPKLCLVVIDVGSI